MKIVQMDGYAANPGDISWEPFKCITAPDGSVCEFITYDRTAVDEVVERAMEADIILTNKVVFSAEVMDQLPNLKYIGVLATGYNVVDVEYAHKKGIVVTNIPAYSTMSVAQCAMAHLLNITNGTEAHSQAVHEGRWSSCPDFTFTVSPQRELWQQKFAVIGLGNTGMATAKVANALGMEVIAYTSKTQEQLPDFIRKAESLEALFKEADVLSLHCPLTPDTKHIINKESLALMKESAIILNTGRGPLIDDAALAEALTEGRIAAAGIDVMTQEPPRDGSPLLTAPNCHITPHVAWATLAARKRLLNIAVENIKCFLGGKPQNMV